MGRSRGARAYSAWPAFSRSPAARYVSASNASNPRPAMIRSNTNTTPPTSTAQATSRSVRRIGFIEPGSYPSNDNHTSPGSHPFVGRGQADGATRSGLAALSARLARGELVEPDRARTLVVDPFDRLDHDLDAEAVVDHVMAG